MSTNRDIAIEIVRTVPATGDVGLLDQWVSPELVDHQPEMADVGLAEMKATLVMLHRVVDNISCTVQDTLEEGDRVLVRWDLRGTASARHPQLPAGASVHNIGMTLFRFDGGRVVERWVNRNEAEPG